MCQLPYLVYPGTQNVVSLLVPLEGKYRALVLPQRAHETPYMMET